MPKTLLIDGDIVVYQQAAAVEEPCHWGDDLWTLHADAGYAKARVDQFLENVKVTLEAETLIVAMSDHENFRTEILPTYKQNRKNMRKPVVLGELRKHLLDKYNAVHYSKLEADDILGIYATSPILGGRIEDKIIVSIDKDFKTVPGTLFNWNNPEVGAIAISLDEANHHHMYQTLIGDTTDNYKGCPGIGPKKAVDIIGSPGDYSAFAMWERVVEAFNKASFGVEEALTQARVAYLLRAGDYNIKQGKIKLWEPPKK